MSVEGKSGEMSDQGALISQLRAEVSRLSAELGEMKRGDTDRQSPAAVTRGGSRHEGSPSGMRLDVKQFGDGSVKQKSECSMKKSPCRDARRRANRRETMTSTSSSEGEVAASFSIFTDNRKIDAALLAEFPPVLRMQAQVWVCDSGSSSHCTHSGVGMTNFRELTGRKLVVASGQSIPIVGIGDV